MKNFCLLLLLNIFSSYAIASTEYETGLRAYNQGNYKFAKTLFEKSISNNPNDVNSRYMLSQIYMKEKNYAMAKFHYQKIINLAPKSQAGQYAQKGIQAIETYNSKTEAIALSQKTVSAVKNNTQSEPKPEIKPVKSEPEVQKLAKSTVKSNYVNTSNSTNSMVEFFYYVPSNIKNSSGYPIIFYLPGLGGDGKSMLHEGKQNFADKNGFAIASITFKFNQRDFDKNMSYQYPSAWSAKAFHDILAKLKNSGVAYKDVYIVGFSAGGQFASRFAIENPGFLKGCAILSSGARVIPDKPNSTRFFFAVGANDEKYRVDNQSKFVDAAKKQNIDVVGKVYPKMGHETSEQEDKDVEQFILQTNSKK